MGKKGKGDSVPVLMPIPKSNAPRREAVDHDNPTWAGLEASKSRLASAMDRCEYLASSRNRFTEVAARQTMDLSKALQRKDPSLHFSRSLTRSVPDLRQTLDDQRELLGTSKTVWKRVDQLNKHVMAKEDKAQGELGKNAAKISAKSATPVILKDVFTSPYDQLATYRLAANGDSREWPLMSVTAGMPYLIPSDALVHGRRLKDLGSTSGSTMSSTRGKH